MKRARIVQLGKKCGFPDGWFAGDYLEEFVKLVEKDMIRKANYRPRTKGGAALRVLVDQVFEQQMTAARRFPSDSLK